MVLLILIWAVDSVTISQAMESVNQIFLLCAKYLCALPLVFGIVAKRNGLKLPKKKDILRLFFSMIFGDILYFFFEYTALKYLPVSTVTILLGFLPGASYLTDRIVLKEKAHAKTIGLILISFIGLAMVVLNGEAHTKNSLIGYVCCAGCIAAWIAYGYLTRSLDTDYSGTAITLYQMIMTVALLLPIALAHRPASLSPHDIWVSIILMGILSSGLGCVIEVKGLIDLGTTVSGVYLNLLPIFTAVAGVVFLHERMSVIQMIGAVIVIICGFEITLQNDV